ncbi:hypothetical protein PspS34_10015 [Pseudomonas sp. S34]|nr:hypothetical protein PspS34_10015 [Pseudomonas sp. S34]
MNTNDRAAPYDIQAPVPAHVIDKGLPTAGLLAHVMMAKFADHLPPITHRRTDTRSHSNTGCRYLFGEPIRRLPVDWRSFDS